jgi:hypothetical protein
MMVIFVTVPGVIDATLARMKLKEVIKVRDSPDKLVEVSSIEKLTPSLEASKFIDTADGVPVKIVCHVS